MPQQSGTDLPTFDSVIDLRHDLFAETPHHQNAGSMAHSQAYEVRVSEHELAFANGGTAEFMHNLANDLEAAVQTHDAR
jgi:hypothetical protein